MFSSAKISIISFGMTLAILTADLFMGEVMKNLKLVLGVAVSLSFISCKSTKDDGSNVQAVESQYYTVKVFDEKKYEINEYSSSDLKTKKNNSSTTNSCKYRFDKFKSDIAGEVARINDLEDRYDDDSISNVLNRYFSRTSTKYAVLRIEKIEFAFFTPYTYDNCVLRVNLTLEHNYWKQSSAVGIAKPVANSISSFQEAMIDGIGKLQFVDKNGQPIK